MSSSICFFLEVDASPNTFYSRLAFLPWAGMGLHILPHSLNKPLCALFEAGQSLDNPFSSLLFRWLYSCSEQTVYERQSTSLLLKLMSFSLECVTSFLQEATGTGSRCQETEKPLKAYVQMDAANLVAFMA